MKDTFSVAQGITLRQKVAGNPCTHWSLLESLSNDSDSAVRSQVAHNQNTPSLLLHHMVEREKDVHVLWVLASNPNTPPVALQELVNRSFVKVEKS